MVKCTVLLVLLCLASPLRANQTHEPEEQSSTKQSTTLSQRCVKTGLVLLLLGITLTFVYQLSHETADVVRKEQELAANAQRAVASEVDALGQQIALANQLDLPLAACTPTPLLTSGVDVGDVQRMEQVERLVNELRLRMANDGSRLGVHMAQYAEQMEKAAAMVQEKEDIYKQLADELAHSGQRLLQEAEQVSAATVNTYAGRNAYFKNEFMENFRVVNMTCKQKQLDELVLPKPIRKFLYDPLGFFRDVTTAARTVREAGDAVLGVGDFLGSGQGQSDRRFDSRRQRDADQCPSDIDPMLYARIQELRTAMPSPPSTEPGVGPSRNSQQTSN